MAIRKLELGKKYGDLKIIEDLGCTKSRHHYYLCLFIICNNEIKILRETLKKNKTTCCSECQKSKKYIGQIIDDYEVIRRLTISDDKKKGIRWECRCQKCGKVLNISNKVLKEGILPKCKCKNSEQPNKSLLDYIF